MKTLWVYFSSDKHDLRGGKHLHSLQQRIPRGELLRDHQLRVPREPHLCIPQLLRGPDPVHQPSGRPQEPGHRQHGMYHYHYPLPRGPYRPQ